MQQLAVRITLASMKHLLSTIAAIRKFCELAAVLLFLLYWPAANLYWIVCYALGLIGMTIGINSTLGGFFGVISVLMAFVVPIWSLAVIAIYYLASALAIASFRIVPLMLFLLALLEWEHYIPNGHIGIDDVIKMTHGEFKNWTHPLMYSVLPVLSGILFYLSKQQQPKSTAR